MSVRDNVSSAASLYHLHTFGELQLYRCDNGEVMSEVGRKPLTLLALLAHAAPRGMERDQLCRLLWPELDQPSARHVLSQTLYALRQQLPGTRVAVGRRELCLAPDISSDLTQFRDAVSRQDTQSAEQVVAGEFLEGLSLAGNDELERWVTSERANVALIYAGLRGEWAAEREGPLNRYQKPETIASMLRPARLKRRVVVGVLGVLSVASAWGLTSSARGESAEVHPRTVREDHAREAAERFAARLAATDSAAIGRVLILPARNHTGRADFDALLSFLDFTLRAEQSREIAQPVPRELTVRLDEEVKAWKKSNSIRTQDVHLLKASGAAVLVRPAIVRMGDSATVRFIFSRAYPDSQSRFDDRSGLETLTYRLFDPIDAQPLMGLMGAASGLVQFMRTMETCSLETRRHEFASPWCWKSRSELAVVPGAASARSEVLAERLRERQKAVAVQLGALPGAM